MSAHGVNRQIVNCSSSVEPVDGWWCEASIRARLEIMETATDRSTQPASVHAPAPAPLRRPRLLPGVLAYVLIRAAVLVGNVLGRFGRVGHRVVEAASARGVEVLDAPVAGQSTGAQAGTLAIYVGGPEEAFDRALPLLRAMGDPERIFHLGRSGAGYTVKLLLNLLWFIESVAVGEVLTVGVRAGLSLDKLYSALVGSPANSNFLERDVRSVLDAGDYDEAFPMRLVTKDLGLAVDLARDVGIPVELTALVEQIHRRARAIYGDDAGEISALRLYEDLAGVELRLRTS